MPQMKGKQQRQTILCVSLYISRPNLLQLKFEVIDLLLLTGILYKDGTINNEASIQRLAEVAFSYAKAG